MPTSMMSVSEIVAKTEAMFDLFNHHFYNDELTARQSPYRRTAGAESMAGAAYMKSGRPAVRRIGKSTSAPSTSTGPSARWQRSCSTKWRIFTTWPMRSRMSATTGTSIIKNSRTLLRPTACASSTTPPTSRRWPKKPSYGWPSSLEWRI